MTTPIKPPGSSPLPPPIERSAYVDETEKQSEALRAVLDAPPSIENRPPISGAAIDPIKSLADELRSGSVDLKTALDRIVERALAGAVSAARSPELKTEIESVLRAALNDDPTIKALVRDLERAD